MSIIIKPLKEEFEISGKGTVESNGYVLTVINQAAEILQLTSKKSLKYKQGGYFAVSFKWKALGSSGNWTTYRSNLKFGTLIEFRGGRQYSSKAVMLLINNEIVAQIPIDIAETEAHYFISINNREYSVYINEELFAKGSTSKTQSSQDVHLYYDINASYGVLSFIGDIYLMSYSYLVLFLSEDQKVKKVNYIKNETPIMTSNTLPWGEVKASSYYTSYYYPYRAFDGAAGDQTYGWLSRYANNVRNEWISFTFPEQTYIEKYEIYAINNSNMPRDFVLQGSDDEAHWETLDEQSLTLSKWKVNQWNTFMIQNPKEYKTYRLFCYNNNGGTYIAIPEMRLSGIKREMIEISYQSPEDFVKYGTPLDELKQIDFSIQFNKKRYIKIEHTQLENGKVYNQKLSQSPIKIYIK